MKPPIAKRYSPRNRCKGNQVFRISKKKRLLFSKIYGLQDKTTPFIKHIPRFRGSIHIIIGKKHPEGIKNTTNRNLDFY